MSTIVIPRSKGVQASGRRIMKVRRGGPGPGKRRAQDIIVLTDEAKAAKAALLTATDRKRIRADFEQAAQAANRAAGAQQVPRHKAKGRPATRKAKVQERREQNDRLRRLEAERRANGGAPTQTAPAFVVWDEIERQAHESADAIAESLPERGLGRQAPIEAALDAAAAAEGQIIHRLKVDQDDRGPVPKAVLEHWGIAEEKAPDPCDGCKHLTKEPEPSAERNIEFCGLEPMPPDLDMEQVEETRTCQYRAEKAPE